ncbi:MAG TPA: FeoB-associated Cys-rich membrane protein [Clostridia bacterium]|nr:FeoB-associated Cys-rich membrane protein [Clostridia bacterium]
MGNIIVSIILIVIIGGAALYIYNAKKSGVKCIGCPHGGKVSGKNNDCNCPSDTVEFKIN